MRWYALMIGFAALQQGFNRRSLQSDVPQGNSETTALLFGSPATHRLRKVSRYRLGTLYQAIIPTSTILQRENHSSHTVGKPFVLVQQQTHHSNQSIEPL